MARTTVCRVCAPFSIGSRVRVKTILESWTEERNLREREREREKREDVYEHLHVDERFVGYRSGRNVMEGDAFKGKKFLSVGGVLMLEMRIMRTGKRIEMRSSDVRRIVERDLIGMPFFFFFF